MGTPVGLPPARLTKVNAATEEPINIDKGIATTKSYAVTTNKPTTSSPKINRHGSSNVKARFSTHNGMPAIILTKEIINKKRKKHDTITQNDKHEEKDKEKIKNCLLKSLAATNSTKSK
ncbi:hypothetical protein HAX54_006867 [Datura stramonium]|uniref:Uncharacterized protein n=1 Tax=Datura stramonium TaxID=4076 RepID=A0ABS8TAT8_DATST|nr:hypothetical protein [Datura stramonium]